MLQLHYSSKFLKDAKKLAGVKNISKLYLIVALLQKGEPLPIKYRNHKLIGNYQGFMELQTFFAGNQR